MSQVTTMSMTSVVVQALSAGNFALANISLDVPAVNCFLFRLPPELKFEVLSYVSMTTVSKEID